MRKIYARTRSWLAIYAELALRVRSSPMPLNFLFILNRMLLFYINFGDCNPPYPALGSNIPSARRPGQRFNFLQCGGCSPSLRFVNRHEGTLAKEGRVGCLHQNIFTRKVTDITFTSERQDVGELKSVSAIWAG